jgi:cystathionine gamma-synthase
MRAVRGYEEKDPAILQHLTSGYPRFVIHPFTRELATHLAATEPELAGLTLWLTTSARMADWLASYLGVASGARRFTQAGLTGVAHEASPDTFSRAKSFLQHTGGFLSSREAEDHLVRLGLRAAPHPEETSPNDATAAVIQQLRRALPGTSDSDLFLAPSGMNAIWAAFRAAAAVQASRGRSVWLQLGWLYLDTIAILRKFTPSPADYVYLRNVFDLGAIERIFAQHGARIAGIFAEVPTNPLIQTPDLPALAALCRRHGALLVVDPSIASVFNVDVLPHSDLVVSSLTKYTASEGDLTAGLVAVNPVAPRSAELRAAVAAGLEPVYPRDIARLAAQIGNTTAVLARIHANTARVAAFLAGHPAVGEVYWALRPECAPHYQRLARTPAATGGMITFTLKRLGALEGFYDRLRLPKGPSFGMKTTLICPFMYLAHYDLVTTPAGLAELSASKLDPDLLRLCCGIEPADEIIAALAEALG